MSQFHFSLRIIALSSLFLSLLTACDNAPDNAKAQKADVETNGDIPVFTDVTARAGLANFHHENGAVGNMWFPEQMGSGCGFVDYNGDGWLDIIIVGGGFLSEEKAKPVQALVLYENNRTGSFVDVTEQAGLSGIRAYGTGIVAADYDNDGDEDLYFTTLGENLLLRNDNGVFVSVGKGAGVANEAVWSSTSLFFDADRDGDLDLYVANYAAWSLETEVFCSMDDGRKEYCPPSQYDGIASRFYRNQGDGTFTDETETAGFLPSPGKSLGIIELDFNDDGWPDIAVADDGERDLLYRNNADGTFTEVGTVSGMAFGENGEARAGMGIDSGVTDDSGEETIFVGNFSNEMIGVYRSLGNGLFISRSAVSRIGQASLLKLTFGIFLFDMEYDGDLDLFVANGHVYPLRTTSQEGITYRQAPQVFLNDGNGVFSEVGQSIGGPLEKMLVARGAVYGDYDHDGDLDIMVSENGGPVHLWRNELTGANYLRVRLTGTTSNREGIGSRVIAVTSGKRQYRRIRTGSSYLSQIEKVASFGFGAGTSVDSLIIQWPSGQEDLLTNLKTNQEITVVEGTGRYALSSVSASLPESMDKIK